MAKELGPFKIDTSKDIGEFTYWADSGPFGWVAHPNGAHYVGDKWLAERRKDMTIIGGITDDDASYSYDDWALVLLDGAYYLFSTSGCSCPSPSETWRVEIGPATLAEVREHVNSGSYEGYTLPKEQHQDFMDVLDYAEKLKG